jgi:hypothetical protein
MMKNKCALLCVMVIFFALAVPLRAGVVTPYISGTSTATFLTDGPYAGWFLYEVNVEWNLNRGLSHWDLILKPGCAKPDHLIEFPDPAGSSGAESGVVHWTGYFELKDKSLDPDLYNPLLKYEPQGNDDDGKTGSGTFYFYSNILPEYKGPYQNVLVAKNGNQPDIWGDLTGAYPSCTVPEPATITLLGGGLLIFLSKKRSR